jgi:hypothetical protein
MPTKFGGGGAPETELHSAVAAVDGPDEHPAAPIPSAPMNATPRSICRRLPPFLMHILSRIVARFARSPTTGVTWVGWSAGSKTPPAVNRRCPVEAALTTRASVVRCAPVSHAPIMAPRRVGWMHRHGHRRRSWRRRRRRPLSCIEAMHRKSRSDRARRTAGPRLRQAVQAHRERTRKARMLGVRPLGSRSGPAAGVFLNLAVGQERVGIA